MEDKRRALKTFFDELISHYSISERLCDLLCQHIQLLHTGQNKVVPGQLGDLQFVLNGFVTKQDEDGKILDFIPSGEFIFHTIISDNSRFVSKVRSTMATLTQESILIILREQHELYLHLSKIYMGILTKRQWRAKFLDKPIAVRKTLFYRMFPKIVQSRPMYEIASYLGSNPNYFGSI